MQINISTPLMVSHRARLVEVQEKKASSEKPRKSTTQLEREDSMKKEPDRKEKSSEGIMQCKQFSVLD